MAIGTVNSDVAAVQLDPKFGSQLDAVRFSGKVQIAECLFTIPTGWVQTDQVRLVKLPARARVIPNLCWIEAEAMGSGNALTLDIGDDDATTLVDPDRYVDGLIVTAGGGFAFTGGDGVSTLTPYTLQEDSWIIATAAATTTTPPAGKKLRFYIAYVVLS